MTKAKIETATVAQKHEVITDLIKQNEVLNAYFNFGEKVAKTKQKAIGGAIEQVVADAVAHFLANETKVKLADIGTFEPKSRPERPGVNQMLKAELIENGVSEEDALAQAQTTFAASKSASWKPTAKFKAELTAN